MYASLGLNDLIGLATSPRQLHQYPTIATQSLQLRSTIACHPFSVIWACFWSILLTHWGQDKMVANLSDDSNSTDIYMLPRFQLTISQRRRGDKPCLNALSFRQQRRRLIFSNLPRHLKWYLGKGSGTFMHWAIGRRLVASSKFSKAQGLMFMLLWYMTGRHSSSASNCWDSCQILQRSDSSRGFNIDLVHRGDDHQLAAEYRGWFSAWAQRMRDAVTK